MINLKRSTDALIAYYKKVHQKMPMTRLALESFSHAYPAKCIFMISGKMGVGKDTFGQILETEIGSQRLAFADKLKEETCEYSGIPVSYFHSQMGKKLIIRPKNSIFRECFDYVMRSVKTCTLSPETESMYIGSKYYYIERKKYKALKSDLDHYFSTISDVKKNYTIRDILIMVGQKKIANDPYAWVSPIYNKIMDKKNNSTFFHITDCRSKVEIDDMANWLKSVGHTVIKIRLERDEVISLSSHITETELDDYSFDIYLENMTIPELENWVRLNLK